MKRIIFLILLFTFKISFSQNYELGKVTIEELKEKVSPLDSSASAAVLFNIGKTYFEYSGDDGFIIKTEIATKIKIYKKEGYDYANHTERIYIGGNGQEKVLFSNAVTYNLVNGKIEKTKLGSDGEFTEKSNKFWSRKKIAMPNVREGSVVEYKVTIISPFISNFPEWEFQKDIPVNYTQYTTLIPEYFFYNTHYKGFFTPTILTDSKSRNITYNYTEKVIPGMGTPMPRRMSSELNFKEAIVKYTLEKVPALKEEAYTNNINNYRATVLHEIAGTRFPDSPFENFTTDWETVAKKIYDHPSFGDELKKTGYFEDDLQKLLNGVTSQEGRMASIFNYVKSTMNWNEYHGIDCDDGVKKAYQNKKGNVAEINLMLTAMLRYAGFDANPVLISTRNNGIFLYPSQSAYNYVIAAVKLPNQMLLMDATSKFALPNILPLRDLNWFGRLIQKDGTSELIDLMPNFNSKEIINIIAQLDSEGKVSGKLRDQYFDYNAFFYRERYNKVNSESLSERIEKRYAGLEVSDFQVQNDDDLSKPVVENYSFTTNNVVEIIGDKMYVNPLLFLTLTENPFKQEIREYPVDFVYPNQNKFNISLTIPEGFKLCHSP
jgi:transglutaminase-like putative cysteine protease